MQLNTTNPTTALIKKPIKKIGIFDSGSGGLTVLQPLLTSFPADYIYVADSANIPYGNKSPQEIIALSKKLVQFLINNDVEIIIVACHTASAHALETLQALFPAIPMIGVIDIGLSHAIQATKNKTIGIIGTSATIASGMHKRHLLENDPTLHVIEQACPELASAIEFELQNTIKIRHLLTNYLAPLQAQNIDTLLLACTHYALVNRYLQALLGEMVSIISADQHISSWLHLQYYPQATATHLTLYATGDVKAFRHHCSPFGDIIDAFDLKQL